MADETPAAAPTPGTVTAPPASGVVDAGGGTLRVTPDTNSEEKNPTLAEQAAEQDKAAGTPTEREPTAEGEAPAAKDGEEPAKGVEVPADFKLEGTVFEGLSEEMQGKIKPFAFAYNQNGTLTDAEVVEAAKATGFSEAAVRQFMAGAETSVSAQAKPLFEAAGGEQSFRDFQGWTQEPGNLTEAEERNINKALESGDYDMMAALAAPAIERWKADGGKGAARDVTQGSPAGSPPGQQSTDVYANWQQVTRDQGDPRYRNDAEFRKNVEAKIARSPLG